jgi:chemotaxis protein CheD
MFWSGVGVMSVDKNSVRKTQICGGEYRVSDNERDLFSTVLGSCIAACIYDPVAGIGGMNHYLLPFNHKQGQNARYGDDALPRLVKHLHLRGAARHRLVAKVYGGARILAGDVDIGQMNIDFADRFLHASDIPIVAFDVGGHAARWVDFHPATGRAFVRLAGARARAAPELLKLALAVSVPAPLPKVAGTGN